MPTLEEAIGTFEQLSKLCETNGIYDSQGLYKQHAAWLRELVERRKAPEIVRCGECKHFQCNIRFDGSIPKGADEYECRRGCGGCDPMDYCCYGERKERRTDD